MNYWYNVDTGVVQTDDNRSRGANVMGPYPSEEEARGALESARAKTEKWDEEDKEWKSRNAAPGWDDEALDD
ncbi:MAG: methionine aminopeptidase [Dermatophilaceae bacterium]